MSIAENEIDMKKCRKILLAIFLGLIIVFILWGIRVQYDYSSYIDKLKEENSVFRDRRAISYLPVMLFEVKRMIGGYSRNYEHAAYNIGLLNPVGLPSRPRVFGYAMYRYFSDAEIDSINSAR